MEIEKKVLNKNWVKWGILESPKQYWKDTSLPEILVLEREEGLI